MRFDYCKANLNTACEEYKYDHCEMCNIARTYQHGYETAQEDMSKTGWILCSEMLPERDEIVLVSYKTTDTVHMCKYLDDGSENPWWSYNDDCLAWNNVILAWMPLPKPWENNNE